MDLALRDKVAVVTGGSKGIGKAIAMALASEGAKVIITARSKDELAEAEADIRTNGADVLSFAMDMKDEAAVAKMIAEVITKFGKIDVLVNNAGGVGQLGAFDEVSLQDWRDLFELNVFAVVNITKQVLPFMQKQKWGRIINISSENGEQPDPNMPQYNATKAALNNLTKTLSKTYGKDNILVNSVSPAFIKTPLVENMLADNAQKDNISKEEAEQQFLKQNRPNIVTGRAGTPEETAGIVAFLASEKASFITGAIYRVDGGSVATL